MDQPGDTPEDAAGGLPGAEPRRRAGPRLWALRVFVLTLLIAGAATVATAAVAIVHSSDGPTGTRTAKFGVIMPDASRYQTVVGELLARKRPRQLLGLRVKGASGDVTVFHARRRGATSFPSDYLNSVALALIARAIGARSDAVITVDELRLEKLRWTGRLRWHLRGERGGRAWRATIAPNGTQLRLLSTKAT